MTTFTNRQPVMEGVYFAVSPPDLVITHERGPLDGVAGARYRRVPFLLVLALGPLIGAIYAMAMPLVIFWVIAQVLGQELTRRRTYHTGEPAPWGVYLGIRRPSVRYVSSSGEPLVGDPNTRYFRVPTTLCILASPLVGAAYVVAFPFILGAGLFYVLGEVVWATAVEQWRKHMHIALPHWEPGAAYLAPPEHASEQATDLVPDRNGLTELADLEAEVRARQAQERA